MRPVFKYALRLFLFIPLISFIFLAAYPGVSRAQECGITIFKSAVENTELTFDFTVTQGGTSEPESLADGERFGRTFTGPDSLVITESTLEGWLLADVECVDVSGLVITNIDNGISVQCVGPNEGGGTCTFVNVLASRPIPTLSEWGMISAAAGLGLIGVFFVIRRRAAVNS